MTDTITTRADRLIEEAEEGAKAYSAHVGGDRNVALNYEIGILRSLVRQLSDAVNLQAESIESQAEEVKRQASAITMLNGTVRSQREQIRRQWEELRDAGLMESDDDSVDVRRDGVAFARSTGAAAALRGEA